MDYGPMILEIFSRVKELEQTVELLRAEIIDLKNASGENEEDDEPEEQEGRSDGSKATRAISRSYVMEKLEEKNPDFIVQKGNRASGADLLLMVKPGHSKEGTVLKAKYYFSKSHIAEHLSSWHTVKAADVQNKGIDLHIFCAVYEGEYYTFFFTPAELRDFVQNKKIDNANLYHFYFHDDRKGKYTEVRDGIRDANQFAERWNLPSDLI